MCTIMKEGVVTDMVWDSKATRLFFGDDQGKVAVCYVPKVRFNDVLCLNFV